jgi:hypothetical protein
MVPMWNGHSCPLPLTLTLMLTLTFKLTLICLYLGSCHSEAPKARGICCPPAAPQLMWRRPLRPSAERSDAHVERPSCPWPLTLILTLITSPALFPQRRRLHSNVQSNVAANHQQV